jgi:hypothetical protein
MTNIRDEEYRPDHSESPEDAVAPNQVFTDGVRPRWYPRVRQEKIRRLYESDAQGLLDEELTEDVAWRLYQRCRSILIATEAHDGRATCPRCETKIPHNWDRAAILRCSGCGWQTTWGAYLKTYQDKQLHGGGAVFAFQLYVEQYPKAQSVRERWLLIDWLIHVFHWELQQHYSRPAACNLIEGKISEVMTFLDRLSYGSESAPETRDRYVEWEGKVMQSNEWLRGMLRASRLERNGVRDGD